MSETRVLAGDIGGTKSHLALFRGAPDDPERVVGRIYQNREFTSLDAVVRQFIADAGVSSVASACFGVAGAVVAGESLLPNLGWHLSEARLARELGLQRVQLINDLHANALGIATLTADQFFTLNAGQARPGGNRALIAGGTGLGMAQLWNEGDVWRVSASEGGHMDFAPRTEDEVALWRFLQARHGHVSTERVVSGPGLVNIYDFLKTVGEEEPDWLAQRFGDIPDRAAVIAQAGMGREADICIRCLEMFLSAYGAAAGNLALTALATGGLYIGGGIAPKLREAFPASGFMAAFTDKGRFAELLASVPVHIILEPETALRGAGSLASSGCAAACSQPV